MFLKKMIAFTAMGLALATTGVAQANLVTNGNFSSYDTPGQLGIVTTVTNWSVPAGGYTWLYSSAANAQAGAPGQFGNLAMWGTSNGGIGPGVVGSPTGGAFIAQDSAFQIQPIQQSISGLIAGNSYVVGFDWAAAQQTGFFGQNSSQWNVSLGGGTVVSTTAITIPSQGGSLWQHESFTLVAGNSNSLLSFVASGAPAVPPFALLDGVSLTASVPEPSSMMLWGLGIVGCGIARLRRRAKIAAV